MLAILSAVTTQKGNLDLQIGWATRSYALVVGNILAVLNDENAMGRLGLSIGARTEANSAEVVFYLAKHVEFTSVDRLWSMALHSEPQSL